MKADILTPSLQPIARSSGGHWPWIPAQGDGTYRNPVIYADYSDPDVIRVGDDFFLTASSFNCTPGLPILHSHDLVNWTIINHAIKNLPHPRYAEVRHGCGVWAPAMRFHAGKFWIFFPMPDEGIYVTTATHPAEKWSKPHLLQEGRGLIDPCPLWDDDGKAYLVHAYARSRAGIKHILQVRPMSPDGSHLLGDGEIIFNNPRRHPTLEGPKFLKKDGWYYISAPAGGVATGWQVILRSKNIYGPYEDKTVLEQGGTSINGPHQGALVDDPGGDWWFIHFQDAGVYGRVVHLQPVIWKDGWPLIGLDQDGNGIGEPVMEHAKLTPPLNGKIGIPQTSDEFGSSELGLQWQWHANHADNWHSLTARKGWLRLFSQIVPESDLSKAPNLLLQKFPAQSFIVETLVDSSASQTGTESGLAVMGRAHAALAVQRNDKGYRIVFRVNNVNQFSWDIPVETVKLRMEVKDGGQCLFSHAINDEFVRVPEIFKAHEGEWIGAKLGLFSLTIDGSQRRDHADFNYFRFR